jgi:hypothetical protein
MPEAQSSLGNPRKPKYRNPDFWSGHHRFWARFRHLIPLFARFGTLGRFPFWLRQRKADGYRAETPSELLVHILVILAEIPRETLNAVFLEWMDGTIPNN